MLKAVVGCDIIFKKAKRDIAMTDKEMRRLDRTQLIEIVCQLKREQQRLEEENQQLRTQLEDRSLCIDKAGSIAEAALDLSGIFEAAQAAADQYLAMIHKNNSELQAHCDMLIQDAQQRADAILAEAEAQAQRMRQEAQCDVEEKWQRFQDETGAILRAHQELSALLKE